MGAQARRPGIEPFDPAWLELGKQHAGEVSAALAGARGSLGSVHHIGSTSVPGLPAKPFIDLQATLLTLPDDASLLSVLEPLGFRSEGGARPDSPGVHRDVPRWDRDAPPDVWRKALFTLGDPLTAGAVILHVRRTDSPWAQWAIAFRDWLRAHDDERDRYAAVKAELMRANAASGDFDDYTRAKTAYFDEVEPRVRAWRQDRLP